MKPEMSKVLAPATRKKLKKSGSRFKLWGQWRGDPWLDSNVWGHSRRSRRRSDRKRKRGLPLRRSDHPKRRHEGEVTMGTGVYTETEVMPFFKEIIKKRLRWKHTRKLKFIGGFRYWGLIMVNTCGPWLSSPISESLWKITLFAF